MNEIQKIKYDQCFRDNKFLREELGDRDEEIQRLKDNIAFLEQKLEQFEDDI